MQTDKEPAPASADGKPPTICSRLQKAFHARPAFRPLLRLTGRPQDGGAATATGGTPAATHGGAPTPVVLPAHAPAPSPAGKAPKPTAPAKHGGAPPPIVLPAHAPAPSPAGKAPKPTAAPVVTLPAAPEKPAAAKGGDKPAGKVPASAAATVSATANKVAEKVAGWMPVPAPPSAVTTGRPLAAPSAVTTGRPLADAKAEDKAQQTKGKVTVSSRVRKAWSSSK